MSEKTPGGDLDEIMAEANGTTTPEIETTEAPAEPEASGEAAEDGRQRDEHGRFATKGEGKAEETSQEANAEQQVDGGEQPSQVPQQALHEERRKRQEAESQIGTMSEQLASMRGQIEAITRLNQPQPQQPQEPAAPPDFWEDADGYTQHHISQAVQPVQQQMQAVMDRMWKMEATSMHGQEAVNEAFETVKTGVNSNDPEAVNAYRAAMSTDQPYLSLVQWHQARKLQAEIGNDPAAYKEKLKAEILAEMKGQTAQQQQPAPPQTRGATPVMPSNLSSSGQGARARGPTLIDPNAPLEEIVGR